MKKLVLALTAAAAFAGPALAADMAPRYSKAPPPPPLPVASWTGCYIAGGGGYGLWNQENTTFDVTTVPRTQVTGMTTAGGRGAFGTVGAGCDYQFPVGAWNFVIGGFGDYDFASMKGNMDFPNLGAFGYEKLTSQWFAGGRVGVLVTPNLLTYFSAGYTEARFGQVNLLNNLAALGPVGTPLGLFVGARNYTGFFLGAGDEYALNFLPGLFWKTEYRFSDLDTKTNAIRVVATGLPGAFADDSHKFVHTVRSELVYRFNWGGPVVARY